MKAHSAVLVSKAHRNTAYSRPNGKRTSTTVQPLQPRQTLSDACGVQKSRSKTSFVSPGKMSPSIQRAFELQRQRQQQVIALQREVRGLLEEEYRQDITAYMHYVESTTMSSPACMDMQPEIQWHMRACLVEFLIEVHLNFRLRPETLYLTCNIVDRYISRRVVFKKHYQLVGCVALWIASKFEDAKERVPSVRDLCDVCSNEYDESAFIQMEGHVLCTLAWRIGHPTAEAWLRIACCGVAFEDAQTGHVARFLMEITLFFREYVPFPPSVIAQAALLLARYTLGKTRRLTDESPAVIAVVRVLDRQLSEHLDDLSQLVVKKYAYSFYSKASTHIVHYYLQGQRYKYVAPILPISIPTTPTHKVLPRVVQEWPSASSTVSSTPSFSGSDFTGYSSDADDTLPQTPQRSPSSIEPLNFAGMTLNVSMPAASVPPPAISSVPVMSSNKENNRPMSVDSIMSVGTIGSQTVVMEGTRTRKPSFEVDFPTIGPVQEPYSMDLCQQSPSSREAMYGPRSALHFLVPNNSTNVAP